jgi:sterol 3beta-glucosyltransferase
LDRFLRLPGKVVFIGFGSMMDDRPGMLNAIVESTLARVGVRAVLLAGPGGQLDLPPSPRRIVVRDIPFDRLFPRVDAIIHHGGAGTTAQAARAGKPSVAVPFFGDQLFWGQRLHRAGGGPSPIPRRALTTERLVAALEAALYDPSHAERAARLGTQVRAEQGSMTAVNLVEARGDAVRGKRPLWTVVGLDQTVPRNGPRSSDR